MIVSMSLFYLGETTRVMSLFAMRLNRVRQDGCLAVGPEGAAEFVSAARASSAVHSSVVNSRERRSNCFCMLFGNHDAVVGAADAAAVDGEV